MNAIIPADVAPHSIEAEQIVLGSIIINPALIGGALSRGGADLFFDPCHAELFNAVVRRDRDSLSIGVIAMRDYAESHQGLTQLGGGKYLVKCAGVAVGAVQFAHHVDLLADYMGKRRLFAAMSEARELIRSGETPAAIIAGKLEAAILEQDLGSSKAPVSMMKAVTGAVQQSFDAKNGKDSGGVQSGLTALDRIVPGFYPGELILLGGRPSMGKTAVALSIALNVARAGHGVAVISLEMTPESMALRAMSEATSLRNDAVYYTNIRQGNFDDRQAETIKRAAMDVSELPITFLPAEYSDLTSMISGVRQIKRAMGDKLRLVVIDYAQILRVKGASRYEQITEISIALKSLAMRLNVPVLALSQLSRSIEQREDKRPMLSDLRESGQLEQDADAVMFCYRDEYYLEREKPVDNAEMLEAWEKAMARAHNRLEIIVAKQRQGTIGTAHMFCAPAVNRIWE